MGTTDQATTGNAIAKSITVEPKDYASKQRRKWLKRLANEFLALSGFFPWKDFLAEKDCPEWVCRVEEEYAAVMFRLADPKRVEKLTVNGFASFLGYQCAYAVWMTENLYAMVENPPKLADKQKDVVLSKEEEEKTLNLLRRYYEWYAALRRLAGRALKACVYQQYEDMSAFLASFSRAFNKKPKLGAGIGDFGGPNFAIYHFMIWNWRAIEGLDSVRELHELLRVKVGGQRTGDLKRVEKICQRIHLHFRSPGRPKKTKS